MSGNWMQTFSGIAFDLDPPNPGSVRLIDIAHGLAHQCRFAGQCLKFYSIAQHSVLVSQIVEKAIGALPCNKLTAAQKAGHVLSALLHDAGEAYTCDVPNPVKIVQREHAQVFESRMQDIVESIDRELATVNRVTLTNDVQAWVNQQLRDLQEMSTGLYDVEKNVWRAVHVAFNLDEPCHVQLVGWRSLADLIKLADLRALATERRDLMSECSRPWALDVAPWSERIEPQPPDVARAAFVARFDALQRARGQKVGV
jgi:hypothetical protein